MPSRTPRQVTRAFVKVLLALARSYEVVLAVTRDSTAAELLKAYKKVVKKTHPDKGGVAADFRRLQAARGEWEACLKSPPQWGRRWANAAQEECSVFL